MQELKPFNSKNIAYNEFFDPSQSMYIEASAGTGKTYTIQQIVARLVSEGTELKNILIVTYTEKAAGELKDRIRKKLEEVIESGKINKDFDSNAEEVKTLNLDPKKNLISIQQKDYFENALRDVDAAPIFTIHSFCQKALKDYAYEAGRPFDMSIVDDVKVKNIIEEWLRSVWVKKQDCEETEFVEILKDSTSISSLIRDITDKLVKAEKSYKGFDIDGSEIVAREDHSTVSVMGIKLNESTLSKISKKEAFEALLEVPEIKNYFNILCQNKEQSFNCLIRKKESSITVATLIKELQQWDGKSVFISATNVGLDPFNFENESLEKAVKFFYNNREDLRNFQKEANATRIQKFILKQIPLLFKEWQKYKIENKLQSYDDMILSVRKNVLAKGINNELSSLALKLGEEFKYAIIDEFQDTNQLQWDIFKTLFLYDKNKHSIIVVGDPKQSIYKFQGADLSVYQSAIEEIGNGYSLTCNFRSTQGIIEACNVLFDEKDNSYFDSDKIKFPTSNVGKFKHEPAIANDSQNPNWETAKPLWISKDIVNDNDFAKAAVAKIVDWCSFVKDKQGNLHTKLRIFDKKNESELRDVTFKDFAILARSRNEMDSIEEAMKKSGVPFVRYKDDKLFVGHECAQWIAIFKAIDASDFSAYNRRILNEALATIFFKIPIEEIESDYYDNPLATERQLIAKWRKLAQKRRFAEMQESIYADTHVEDRLKDISLLQTRAKFIQIGNYAINYLYSNACSLSDVISLLTTLSKKNVTLDDDDKDGNLIGKATDADVVQVMTIHASKGLEFPVVISVAGFKQLPANESGPFLYHNNGQLAIGFSSTAKEDCKKETIDEWKRLFYVDYTRASSILVLPRYKAWNANNELSFLFNSFTRFCTSENEKFIQYLDTPEQSGAEYEKVLQNKVNEILLLSKTNAQNESSEDEQRIILKEMANSMPEHCISQHSYSSLGGNKESDISTNTNTNLNKNGTDPNEVANKSNERPLIDNNPVRIVQSNFDNNGNGYDEDSIKFPKGAKLGNAIHSIFENVKFQDFGIFDNSNDALEYPEFSELVEEQFKIQSLPIAHHPKWLKHSAEIIFNTLHAKLPVIHGNTKIPGESFQLTSLEEDNRKAEMQFHFTEDGNAIKAEKYLNTICKGFIDLAFVRGEPGNERYSILDWKTDFIANSNYDFESVMQRVDKDYSIQRVLYCYLLIKWLKTFKKNLDEQAIFEKHFGGIYYAFVRGCKANTDNGIYAQTWENWTALETEYKKITSLMHK